MEEVVPACIGDSGKWQLRVALLMAFLKFSLSWNQYIMLFYSPPQKFWCKNPVSNNTDQCIYLNLDNETSNCEDFEFDKSAYTSTITSEWNLICGNSLLVEFSQIIVLIGFTIGSLIFGMLSDKYGRRKPLISAIVINVMAQFAVAYIPSYTGFIIARFVVSLVSGAMGVISFVLCMEVFGGKWRIIIPIVYQIPFGIGGAFISILAYFIRDWRHLQVTLSFISVIYLFYIILTPESPRWLLAKNRKDEAIKLLQRVAKINGRNCESVYKLVQLKPTVQRSIHYRENVKKYVINLKSLLLWILWANTGVITYGYVLNFGNISNDIFLMSGTTALSLFPALLLSIFLSHYFQRKRLLMFCYFALTITTFLTVLIPKGYFNYDWPRFTLIVASVVLFGISTPVLYIYSGELYPTVVRNIGMGAAMLFLRLGGSLSPIIISTHRVYEQLPMIIFGIAAFLMLIVTCPLPETDKTYLLNVDLNEDFNRNVPDAYQKVETEDKEMQVRSQN